MQDKIKSVKIYEVKVPLTETFKIATGSRKNYEGIMIEIETEGGISGFGEAVPVPYVLNETVPQVEKFLKDFSKYLSGKNPSDRGKIMRELRKINAPHSGSTAVNTALWDIIGKTAKMPVYSLLGEDGRKIGISGTISIGTEKETAKSAERLLKAGFKALKMKVGLNLKEDVKRVKLVRSLSKKAKIYLDANQGYSAEEAVKFANSVAKFGISFIEQPVNAGDIISLKKVKENSPVPIMADESVKNAEDALTILRADAADYINVKLTKAGSIEEGLKIANLAHLFGKKVMLGCMVGSPLLISASFSLFKAGRFDFADLDGFLTFSESPVEGGAYIENGYLKISRGSGLSVKRIKEKYARRIQ